VQAQQAPPAAQIHAITPQSRDEAWWLTRHAEKSDEMSKRDIDLLMIGDSITHSFDGAGAKVWKEYFEPRKAINLGFGGDRTQHVLWRLEHLPKPKKAPKGAVVLIGTNNICWGSDTPRHAAEGVQAVVRKLQALYPETKILVLAVFPRRAEPDHRFRKQINELNSYLPELLKDMKNVTLLDIGPKFLDDKGFLLKGVMPDTTHPSEKGYEIWAKAIEPELNRMLGEKTAGPASAPAPVAVADTATDKLSPDAKGNVTLTTEAAELHGEQMKEEKGGRPNIGGWDNAADWVSWKVKFTEIGSFKVSAQIATEDESELVLEVEGQQISAKVPRTGGWGNFVAVDMGKIEIKEAKEQVVKARPKDAQTWKPVNLNIITLERVK
jgi:beta-glucosidase